MVAGEPVAMQRGRTDMGLGNARELVAAIIGDPEIVSELRQGLQASAAAGPPRPVMAAKERRSIGAELAERYAVFEAERMAWARERDEAQARFEAARKALDQVYRRQPDPEAYCQWRDPQLSRLWSERSCLVDELLAQLQAEMESLSPNDPRGGALHALGEAVTRWTTWGLYSNDYELTALFEKAYKAIPGAALVVKHGIVSWLSGLGALPGRRAPAA